MDLVQFPSGIAAQAGASPPEIVRGQIFNGCLFCVVLYDMPHDPLRYAGSPGLACATNAPKDAALAYAGGYQPGIDGALDPIRNRHCPNMSGLADQIDDGPVVVPPLEMRNIQFCGLFAAQATTQAEPEQCSISLALERIPVRGLPERICLFGGEPVTKANTKVFGPLTRRMPAARSGLSRPESAASYARRLTTASLPLIVPGAS